jgi:ubiquinone/menaquinone biosynthesis C-methylase UbiE
VDDLSEPDLAPVDQLHLGGRGTTQVVVERLGLGDGTRLLDVGSGVGGPARTAADACGCHVTGIDLTPDFTDAANELAELVGLSDTVEFRTADATDLPFADGAFDAAMQVHVGMNVPDKPAVFAEVARVLRPGGRFVVFEQMRSGDTEPRYPCPWAADPAASFLATEEEYREMLAAAGFRVVDVEDLTELGLELMAKNRAASEEGPDAPGRLSLFGPDWAERIGNDVEALSGGVLRAKLVVAELP